MTRTSHRSSAAHEGPRAIPKADPLPCPECNGRMYLRMAKYGLAYLCQNWPACTGAHGAHPDGKPLGTPASKDVRVARIRAHAAFDELWKDADQLTCYAPQNDGERGFLKKVARKRAYAWLRDRMNMDREQCHIGDFDIETCARVVEISRGMGPELVRQWAHERKAQHQAEAAA